MSQSSWLVAGVVPGIERHPVKKLEPDATALLRLLYRWLGAAEKVGRPITRITLAFEAGRGGFWLARWLRRHDIEAHVVFWRRGGRAGDETAPGESWPSYGRRPRHIGRGWS
jgi:transposase